MAEATRKDTDTETDSRFERSGATTVDERRAPDDVTDLPKESFKGVLKRAIREFNEDKVTDWAAALTYYGVLSIFPMLLALVSLLGLFGQPATQPLLDNIGSIAPGPGKQIITNAITNLQKSQGGAGIMFVVGLADTGNPIGPLTTPQNDTLGSFQARDELLKRNGCVAQDFALTTTDAMKFGNAPHEMWDAAYPKCQKYSGCPAKYPVVWCPLDVNHGNGPNPMGGDAALVEPYRRVGMWKFFSTLP